MTVPEIVVEDVSVRTGGGEALDELAVAAARAFAGEDIGAVVAATFSNSRRFPALAVRIASELGLPEETPALDLQMACSAYPYALYLASRLARDTGKKALVVDGDVQSRLVDAADHATGGIFSDAVTASLVTTGGGTSPVAFYSRHDESLVCGETGPIKMDGFKVFTFVATEVSKFLRAFGTDFDFVAPHQANPYLIRQLAKTLGLEEKLLVLDEGAKNPGSCSVPMTLHAHADRLKGGKRVLIAGFGAGLSASACVIRFGRTIQG